VDNRGNSSTSFRGVAVITRTGKLTHIANYRSRVRGRTHCGQQVYDLASGDVSVVTCPICLRKEAEDPITNPELAVVMHGGRLAQ
jgi:hypothetical protein